MVVPAFLALSSMVQVTVCAAPSVTATAAVNSWVSPLATLAVFGLMVTLVTLPTLIVTVAVSDLLGSAVDAAFTVRLVKVSSAATVRRPVSLMVVPAFLALSSMDQVTVFAAFPVTATVAANSRVPPLTTLGVLGLMVTLVMAALLPPLSSEPVGQAVKIPISSIRAAMPVNMLLNFFMDFSLLKTASVFAAFLL